MDFLNLFFILSVSTGLVYVIAGYILYIKPPKNINPLYGYRTTQSMSSQEKWDFAQKYSAREMIKQGKFMILISLLGLFLNPGDILSIISFLILILFSIIALFSKTEKQLKQKFESNETL